MFLEPVKEVEPSPGNVVVLEGGYHESKVGHISQVLVLQALVTQSNFQLRNLYVNKHFVLLRSLLYRVEIT